MRALESAGMGGLHDLLLPLVHLYAARCVEADLGWFMAQEVLPPKVGVGAGRGVGGGCGCGRGGGGRGAWDEWLGGCAGLPPPEVCGWEGEKG